MDLNAKMLVLGVERLREGDEAHAVSICHLVSVSSAAGLAEHPLRRHASLALHQESSSMLKRSLSEHATTQKSIGFANDRHKHGWTTSAKVPRTHQRRAGPKCRMEGGPNFLVSILPLQVAKRIHPPLLSFLRIEAAPDPSLHPGLPMNPVP